MNGSTVVIIPANGGVKDYLDSLQRLLMFPLETIALGRGELPANAPQEIEGVIRYRLAREDKAPGGLRRRGGVSLEQLVVDIYDDAGGSLCGLHFLWARLLKLEKNGLTLGTAGRDFANENWELVAPDGK